VQSRKPTMIHDRSQHHNPASLKLRKTQSCKAVVQQFGIEAYSLREQTQVHRTQVGNTLEERTTFENCDRTSNLKSYTLGRAPSSHLIDENCVSTQYRSQMNSATRPLSRRKAPTDLAGLESRRLSEPVPLQAVPRPQPSLPRKLLVKLRSPGRIHEAVPGIRREQE